MNEIFNKIKYYSLFPYLDESINYVNSLKITIDDILTSPFFEKVRLNGEKKIIDVINNKFKKGIYDNEDDILIELLSYPYIKILLSCTNNLKLIRKYIYFESLSSINFIKKSSYFTIEKLISFSINLHLNIKIKNDNLLSIYFYDYIKYSINFRDVSWKLINQNIEKGYVIIDIKNYYRFLQEVIFHKIEKSFSFKIPNHLKVICIQQTKNINDYYNNYLNNNENISIYNNINIIDIKKFPNCISNAILQINNGINISHSMRFALVTFLYSIGMKKEDILKFFFSSPDFNIDQVKYQINHIIDRNYKCPSCSTMRTYGNCNNICQINSINSTPIIVYYNKVKNK